MMTPDGRRTILRGASKVISDKFSEVWKQEKVQIEIEKQDSYLSFSISDGIAISSTPQERSEGFQWFLSFFANFLTEGEKFPNAIILLDEPGINLHPRGQKDIVRMLERVSKTNQIIYTSHSPFLINRNFPSRIRVLRKDHVNGTVINNKPYSDGRTRFWEPLKSSIGICLADLFSLGEINLIVEGVSDQILISFITNKFASRRTLP